MTLTVFNGTVCSVLLEQINDNKESAQRDSNTACALAVRTPPARYNARPPQTGPITIHCAA